MCKIRGSATVFLLVILAVVVTSTVIVMATVAGAQTAVTDQDFHKSATFYAAQAGLQAAAWQLKHNPQWPSNTNSQLSGAVGNCTYTVTATAEGPGGLFWNSPILLTSVGADSAAHCTVTATANPTNNVPTFALGGNYTNNGNLTMQGDLAALGSITTSGTLTVTGSLKAGGSISTKGNYNISGPITPNATGITVPSVSAIYNQLAASPGVEVLSASNVQTLDFNAHPIILINGNTDFSSSTPVTVEGSGTLLVNGDLTIQSAAALGTGSLAANLNIVTTGSFDIQGKLYINGSVYVGGTLTKGGAYGVKGVVVVAQDASNGGGDTFTRAAPPSFDPRYPYTGGAGDVTLNNFSEAVF